MGVRSCILNRFHILFFCERSTGRHNLEHSVQYRTWELDHARTDAPIKEGTYSRYWKNYLPAAGEENFGLEGPELCFSSIFSW